MQGPKTHEPQLRILEKKLDVPDRRQVEMALEQSEGKSLLQRGPAARESEFPLSRKGMNQDSSSSA
jgi:hypothetical protein